jgi:hypothetical protein
MDLGFLQWMEESFGRTSSKRDSKGETPMCSNFIMVPLDMWITNFSVLRVPNGVSDGVLDGVSNGVLYGVLDGVWEYWRVRSRTMNYSQYIYNFSKWLF